MDKVYISKQVFTSPPPVFNRVLFVYLEGRGFSSSANQNSELGCNFCRHCKSISFKPHRYLYSAGWSLFKLQGENAGYGSPLSPHPGLFSELCLSKQRGRLLTPLFSLSRSKSLCVKMHTATFSFFPVKTLSGPALQGTLGNQHLVFI